MKQENNMWKGIWVSTILIVIITALPLVLLTNIPETDSFDRHNTYDVDGYRNAGYYIVRHNASLDGFINITHPGGTNIFYIETNNIQNITLDLETLYGNRRYLFGWLEITWLDAVKSVNEIVIYINTTDGIDNFRFTEYPGTLFKVTVNDTIRHDWSTIPSGVRNETGVDAGNNTVILNLQRAPITIYDIMVGLFQVMVPLAVIFGIMGFMISATNPKSGGKR